LWIVIHSLIILSPRESLAASAIFREESQIQSGAKNPFLYRKVQRSQQMAEESNKKYSRKQKRKHPRSKEATRNVGVAERKSAETPRLGTVNKSDKGGRQKSGGGRGKKRK